MRKKVSRCKNSQNQLSRLQILKNTTLAPLEGQPPFVIQSKTFFMRHLGFVFAIALCLVMPRALAQLHQAFSYSDYKPTVQHSTLQWNCHTFGNLNVYYDGDGNELASMVAWYTKQQLEKLGVKTGIRYQGLLHVLIYNHIDAFLSSNLGSAMPTSKGLGWNHEIAIDRIVVVNTGSLYDCQRQIRKELAKLLLNVYFNGSSYRNQLVNQTLLNLPEWFVDGLADYLAGWVNHDQKARFAELLSQKHLNFNLLTDSDWKTVGYFLFQYIQHSYDSEQWQEIVSLTRATRSAEDALSIALGQSINRLFTECFSYYRLQFGLVSEHRKHAQPSLASLIPKHAVSVPVVSQTGRYLATTSKHPRNFVVWLTDTLSKRAKKILSVPNLGNEQSLTPQSILMQWSPILDNLILIARFNGKLMLYQYDVPSGHIRKRAFDFFEAVNGFSVSPDGSRLVLSAVKDGLTDIFTTTLASMHIERLSKDVYDDLYPFFVSHNQVVFSSNRTTPTLFPLFVELTKELRPQMDLFLLALPAPIPKPKAIQLTFTDTQNEVGIGSVNDASFCFLVQSDFASQASIGILDSTLISYDTLAHFQQYLRAFTADKALSFRANQHYASAFKMLVSRMGDGSLAFEKLIQLPRNSYQTNVGQTDGGFQPTSDSLADKQPNIGFADYQFTSEALQKTGFVEFENISKTSQQPKDLKRFRLKGLIPYSPQFFVRRISSAIDFSAYNYAYQLVNNTQNPEFQVPGFNILTQGGTSDLTEDRHIELGVRISADLMNNEYLLRYRNLKHRLDKEFTIYYRNSQQTTNDGIVSNRVFFVGNKVLWPLKMHSGFWCRLGLNYSLGYPKAVDETNLRKPSMAEVRPEIALAFEHNSQQQLLVNLRKGLAYRVFAEAFYTSRFNSFLYSMGFDFRAYNRLGTSLFTAIRVAAGTSGSKGKLLFVLGGLHNQLNAEFESQVPVAVQSNYLYMSHNAGLRGYKIGVRRGSSYVLTSAEVRIPFISMLVSRPLRSEFLKNMQIVGFADVGTAWTGWSPFSDDNELYVRYISNGPISVKLFEQHQPVVASSGLGLRALIVGYFIKLDYAWPLYDGRFQQPALQVSMGLDF